VRQLELAVQPKASPEALPGVGLFYSGSLHGVPHVLTQLVNSFPYMCSFVLFTLLFDCLTTNGLWLLSRKPGCMGVCMLHCS
jgi:hypothetical protein